jgi:hypothetical protein
MIIPLGDHCAIAMILKELNMREKSYPFDWIAHYESLNNSSIYTIFEIINKLNSSPNIDEIIENYIGDAFTNNKINSKNQLWFPHDEINEKENITVHDIFQKYRRRFERLLDSLNHNKNIFIIVTRIFYIEEEKFNILYNTIMNYNKDNIIIFISGSTHNYFNVNNYNNVIYKYIHYQKELYYNYDYTHFRPLIKYFLNNILNILLNK